MNPELPQQPPVLPPHHVSQSMKVIMLVFGLILVGTLGFFIYDAQKAADDTDYTAPKVTTTETKTEETAATTTDETADWKTYSNVQLGFSIKHPSEWIENIEAAELSEMNTSRGYSTVYFLTPDRKKQLDAKEGVRGFDVMVRIYKSAATLPNNTTSLTFENWIAQKADAYGFTNRTTTKIGGKSGYTGSGDEATTLFFVQPGKEYVYEIEIDTPPVTKDTARAVVDSLIFLSTQ